MSDRWKLVAVLGSSLLGAACAPAPTCEDTATCERDRPDAGMPDVPEGGQFDAATVPDGDSYLDVATSDSSDGSPPGADRSPIEAATATMDGGSDADAATCPDLPAIVNGDLIVDSPAVGGTVRHQCKIGYELSGAQERVCQGSGTWSGESSVCTPVDCGRPRELSGVAVEYGATTYLATATYRCASEDFVLSPKDATSTCQANGEWSLKSVRCDLADCGHPGDLAHGKVTVGKQTAHGTADYQCLKGHQLIGYYRRTCEKGADGIWGWTHSAPTCERPLSCQSGGPGAGFDCGANGDDDCCGSLLVPETQYGFKRDNDARYSVRVSAFTLDKYEVTVGRFQAFVNAGMGTQAKAPAEGGGLNPAVPGSGWTPDWNKNLTDADTLTTAIQTCDANYRTWGRPNGEHRPMNCITWYEAFAFCIWDGGRLPTDLEWNYAAAGGSEQFSYPWGGAAPGNDVARAIYGCFYNADGICTDVSNIAPVGSVGELGKARWGQMDMAGNVSEWVLDTYEDSHALDCSSNCSHLARFGSKVHRGGHYRSAAVALLTSSIYSTAPEDRLREIGVRCARRVL